MDEESQKIIMEQLRIMPSDVKEAILSVDYKTKLQEITQRQKLLIDQAGKLEMETSLVMIGLEPLTDYVANLQREMGLTETRAKEIALDVSDSIFKPIRDSLRAMNGETGNEDGEDNQTEKKPKEEIIRFTNSNETILNRDQILNEIENPSIIEGGDRKIDLEKQISALTPKVDKIPKPTELEIRPAQELETLPNEKVKDVVKNTEIGENILQTKMTRPTIVTQQIIDAKPEIKLPEIKKKPMSSIDPYREPVS